MAKRIWTFLKTLLLASAFIAFFIVYLPLLAGSYVVLRCLFAFAWTGRGTPAPFANEHLSLR